jgi:hypothetical protein
VTNTTAIYLSHPLLEVINIAVQLIFFSLTLVIAFHHVIFTGEVDWNRIVGAICIFFLLGIIWALLFHINLMLVPGSIKGLTTTTSSSERFSELIYFSFVTLSSLGYGDIVPIGPFARVLAYLEAVIGQFYIGILVAGLIGAYITAHDPRKNR